MEDRVAQLIQEGPFKNGYAITYQGASELVEILCPSLQRMESQSWSYKPIVVEQMVVVDMCNLGEESQKCQTHNQNLVGGMLC